MILALTDGVRVFEDRLGASLALAALVVTAACAGSGSTAPIPASGTSMEEFHAGQIIEAATGRALVVDQLITQVLQQDVVYLGEEHHNRFHIEAALAILKGVTVAGRRPILAMEMFGWDGQAVLDRYLSTPEMNRQDFLDQVRWTQNWGGPFEDYEPLVQYARTQRLRLITMNPPKSLVRAVAKQGLDPARQSVELSQWNMDNETIVDDPAYRARILQQLRACHDAGPDALYQTMYEASMVRDEGMARTIVSQVQQLRAGNDPSAGPVVSYTGGGHIQYNLPVPKRVARRLDQHIRQLSIYMTSFEKDRIGDLKDMLKERIADYVWLTSVSPQGPPRRCR